MLTFRNFYRNTHNQYRIQTQEEVLNQTLLSVDIKKLGVEGILRIWRAKKLQEILDIEKMLVIKSVGLKAVSVIVGRV